LEKYEMYLNGRFYGSGSLEYMKELFVDYVVTCRMYGKNDVTISIQKEKS
jgi:hypothetical protein